MSESPRPPDPGAHRLLDAVGNRLEEALRTIEDQLRFRHGASATPRAWRDLRHQVAALRRGLALAGSPLGLHRDVLGDPGRPEVTSPAPAHSDPAAILAANFARAREGARSLEEELRLHDREAAREAERIRYRVYALEGVVLGQQQRGPRLAGARLYVLVTTALASAPPEEATRAALAGGANVIQLREKTMEGGDLLALADRLREITAEHGALLVVNDRIDIAALSGADGVHLGQGDVRPTVARRILGPDAIIGLSTHAPEEASRAAELGADYIGIGPIYPTNTKEHRRAVGLEYIRQAADATDLPGFAIGNVSRATIDTILEAGARRVAICTGVIAAPDIEAAARFFRARLDALE